MRSTSPAASPWGSSHRPSHRTQVPQLLLRFRGTGITRHSIPYSRHSC